MNGYRINCHKDLKVGEPYLFLMSQPHTQRGLECIWMVLVLEKLKCRAGHAPIYGFVNPITERQIWFTSEELFRLLVFDTLQGGFRYVDQIVRKALGGRCDDKREGNPIDSEGT
jgi:hypothetical protein